MSNNSDSKYDDQDMTAYNIDFLYSDYAYIAKLIKADIERRKNEQRPNKDILKSATDLHQDIIEILRWARHDHAVAHGRPPLPNSLQ